MNRALGKLAAAAAAFILVTACAPMAEVQRESRDYRNDDYALQFKEYRTRCLRRGGTVYVMASADMRRDEVPQTGDRYYCM